MADSPVVEVKILFFAKARELSGLKEKSLQQSLILAINEEYASSEGEIQLKAGDEIAVIPPLSGGKINMDYVKVVNTKLSVEEISALVTAPACGAISLFVGTTRDNFNNKQVVQLEYEAYEPMALKAMKKVCADIREKWSVENIAIYHRLGVVPVKEASIVIAVSSPHRAESLQAVQFAIDTIKASTPIWKKEVYASQETRNIIEIKIKTEPEEEEATAVKCKPAPVEVPSHLIQIKAGSQEIQRRINSFIEWKREQVNLGNIQDFCFHGSASLNEFSCARVDALLIRRKDSKSHLRVRRVLNTWGPQTRGLDPGSTDPQSIAKLEESGVEERLANAEAHLKIQGPVPRNIYCRLKRIEDRILHLEGLSPEYFYLWENGGNEEESGFHRSVKKKKYSAAELDNKLCDLEYKLTKKLNR